MGTFQFTWKIRYQSDDKKCPNSAVADIGTMTAGDSRSREKIPTRGRRSRKRLDEKRRQEKEETGERQKAQMLET